VERGGTHGLEAHARLRIRHRYYRTYRVSSTAVPARLIIRHGVQHRMLTTIVTNSATPRPESVTLAVGNPPALIYRTAWLACAIALSVCCSTKGEQLLLRCDYGEQDEIYLLDDLEKKARTVLLMGVEPPRSGTVSVSDSAYHLEFAATEQALPVNVVINRFTTAAVRTIDFEVKRRAAKFETRQQNGNCVLMKGRHLNYRAFPG
jgi:hypothetical protein